MKKQRSQQVSRLRRAPEFVGELIRIANCAPVDEELPDLFAEVAEWNLVAPFPETVAKFRKHVEERFPGQKFREVRRLIGPIQPETWDQVVRHYAFLHSTHGLLKTIAQAAKRPGQLSLPALGLNEVMNLEINEKGLIELVPNDLVRALTGVEAARIRQCSVCRAIYWAGRLDKPACGRKCRNILRTRRWRERYPERYKQQRYRKST